MRMHVSNSTQLNVCTFHAANTPLSRSRVSASSRHFLSSQGQQSKGATFERSTQGHRSTLSCKAADPRVGPVGSLDNTSSSSSSSVSSSSSLSSSSPSSAAAAATPTSSKSAENNVVTNTPALTGPPAWALYNDTSSSKNLRVAVDVDEVLARFLHGLNMYVKDTHSMHYSEENYFEYNFARVWQCDQETSAQIVHAFFESEEHFRSGLEVLPGAKSALKSLKEKMGCSLCVVTSRQNVIRELTEAWITHEFGDTFDDVLFGNHWTLDPNEPSKTKAQLCEEVNADVLVDDNVGYAQEVAGAGYQVVLFGDYAWNDTNDLHPNVTRAACWEEAELVLTNFALVKRMGDDARGEVQLPPL